MIDAHTAARFARLTLGHVTREYPNVIVHVLEGPEDARTPSELHPIFHGSLDWHSCVHGWWQLLRLARLHPDLPEAAETAMLADKMLTADRMAGEIAYFQRPSAGSYERPYGWAWALKLHAEAEGTHWAPVMAPLADLIADRFRAHVPKLTYPIRVGTHFNTAFALILALDWAERHDATLAKLIGEQARGWYGQDRAAQAWEPGGDDFLSGTLTEALLMSRLLDAPAFAKWFDAFLPDIGRRSPATLLEPAHVSDRSDGKIAHLDGLNLSRAWCWRGIATALSEGHPAHATVRHAASRHLDASLPHVEGDYMGEHWLATFALLALEAG